MRKAATALPFLLFTLAFTLALLVRGSSLAPLGAQTATQRAPSTGTPTVLRGATILTITKGAIPNGTIVIRNGKIAAVGTDVQMPPNAEVIDVGGKFVSPGLIDAHSHIAADSINEGGTTVSSMTGIEDVLDPSDINIYRDLAGGLTTANVLHGSANPIGGKNAVIKLRWGKTRAEELLFEGAMPGIKFALGENPKDIQQFAAAQGPRRYPLSRPGVEFVIRDAFTRAKAYQRAWKDYDTRKRAGENVIPPRRDLQLEPLVEILDGKRLVHAHCYRADEILMLIRLAEEIGFKIATFQHVLEGYKVAKEIAAHGAGASTFSDWWGYKIEAIDAIPHNAALMTRKGVLVSVNSDSAEHARRLNTEAAKSIKWGGLNEDEALALVTINPAKQLRIADRVGSVETGKDADLVVWTRHPLSSYAIVDRAYIDGLLYYDRQAEQRRLTQIHQERNQLVNAARSQTTGPTTEGDESTGQVPKPPQPDTTDRERRDRAGETRASTTGSGGGQFVTQVSALMPPTSGGVYVESTATSASPGQQVDASRRQPASSGGSRAPLLAITNARIHPITQPDIERGTIVIRDGKIEAVGANVSVPAGAKVIDAAGASVYPGFINARTTLGVSEPGARGFADTDEMLEYNPQLRTMVAFHSDSDAIPVARANGVTTVAVSPSGGVLAGQVAVMNLDGWTWEENTLRPVAGIAFQFPTIAGGGGRGGGPPVAAEPEGTRERTFEDLKKERDARLDELANLFERARAYGRASAQDRRTDWTLEALVPVVDRKIQLITRVDRERDIRDAVAFAERVNVRMVISGGLEAPLVAPLLSEKGIPVILGSILTLPPREDMAHSYSYEVATELARAKVKFAFSTGDNTNIRQLPYQAAESIAWGLSREDALKALTITAAEILGIADQVGSIETGKMANLMIAKGDPLEVKTEVTNVIIRGRDVGLANKQQALYERYLARP